MSIKVMSWVWGDGPADQAECFVLLALANYADDNGVCWSSMGGIAAKVRMKECGVRNIIGRLKTGGWLEIEYGAARAGANRYRILDPTPARGAPRYENPLTPAPRAPEPSLTSIEPSGIVTDSTREFEAVWSMYPRQVAKGAAAKAWIAARKIATFEQIDLALESFVRTAQGCDMRYIPHLATWLEDRRWEDNPAAAVNRPRTSTADLTDLAKSDNFARLMRRRPRAKR